MKVQWIARSALVQAIQVRIPMTADKFNTNVKGFWIPRNKCNQISYRAIIFLGNFRRVNSSEGMNSLFNLLYQVQFLAATLKYFLQRPKNLRFKKVRTGNSINSGIEKNTEKSKIMLGSDSEHHLINKTNHLLT